MNKYINFFLAFNIIFVITNIQYIDYKDVLFFYSYFYFLAITTISYICMNFSARFISAYIIKNNRKVKILQKLLLLSNSILYSSYVIITKIIIIFFNIKLNSILYILIMSAIYTPNYCLILYFNIIKHHKEIHTIKQFKNNFKQFYQIVKKHEKKYLQYFQIFYFMLMITDDYIYFFNSKEATITKYFIDSSEVIDRKLIMGCTNIINIIIWKIINKL